MEVKPIGVDDPGLCDMTRLGKTCNAEAVVSATLLVPGLPHASVTVKFCRLDWAAVVETEELDLRKAIARANPETNYED